MSERIPSEFLPHDEPKLPYEETEAGFNEWFRKAAKDEWELFLQDNRAADGERYQALQTFLYENGTQEEIDRWLNTLRQKGNGMAADAQSEELIKIRPGLKFDGISPRRAAQLRRNK
ncbi:MAG: hypothetical protein AAB880_01880 [Patescibacteria group bacterium]